MLHFGTNPNYISYASVAYGTSSGWTGSFPILAASTYAEWGMSNLYDTKI